MSLYLSIHFYYFPNWTKYILLYLFKHNISLEKMVKVEFMEDTNS